ncbi:MAG: aminodeoxychorismate synthase component I [Acidobacteriia bacterium]|nr:aminodeoxychorismate synthase component I [Terriglobia bacterium]
MNVLLIDNRDSFTYNLSQLIAKVTAHKPVVIDNAASHWRDVVTEIRADVIVISPGPGTPARYEDFGVCSEVILESDIPLLGVCLGHQGIGYAHGARVVPAPVPMHGRISRVSHDGSDFFRDIPADFDVVRYHSLCIESDSLPACLTATASTADGVVMAVQHKSRPQFGVQFHPESVSADFGEQLVRNFLRLAARYAQHQTLKQPRPTKGGPTFNRSAATRASTVDPARIESRVIERWVNPQDAFQRLYGDAEHAFWLDSSAVIPSHSRFSFMGDASGPEGAALLYRSADRRLTVRTRAGTKTEQVTSLLAELRNRLGRPVQLDPTLPFDFQTGLVGFFGYEFRDQVGLPTSRRSATPDAAFVDSERCIVFDHAERRVYLVARVGPSSDDPAIWFDSTERAIFGQDRTGSQPALENKPAVAHLADGPKTYLGKIRHCQTELAAGESYQICLSSEFSVTCDVGAFEAYRALRALNPAPHAAYLRFGDLALLSSSPERFLRVDPDRVVWAKPIKGTCPRGSTAEDDTRLAEWLRDDEKTRSENLMIVDLLRNDIGRIASTGSVRVPKLMDVESYATVHQLVSTVAGKLRPDRDCLDCVAAAFPGGSMTGAPKARTLSIIDRLEERARGPYSGALGYLSYGDRMDLSIVIRAIVMDGMSVSVASGGAIVAMSKPEDEFDEMLLKARAPLAALALASTGDAEAWELRYASP